MTFKIFRTAFLVGLTVLLLCMVLFLVVLHEHYEARVYADLELQASYIAQAVERMGEDYFRDFTPPNRVTWAAEDGTVLYDSVADAGSMDNHLNRQEIAAALVEGQGQSAHISQTLMEKTLYYALRLSDGSVLRVAVNESSAMSLLLSMVQPLLWIVVLSLLLSALLASRQARKITRPLNKLDPENPELPEGYNELQPLLQRLREQTRTIHQQMDALRRRQREFETIIGNMSEGVLLFDRGSLVLSGNKSGRAIYERESTVIRRCAGAAAAGERTEESFELDGHCFAVLADPVISSGWVSGAVVLIMDVTEREQRERLRREFSANVSHELKTPLTSISGFAELMKEGVVPPDKMREFAGDIHKESQRLIQLVEDIIRLSRLDEGSAPLERERVELSALCREVLDSLSTQAETNGIELRLEGCAEISGVRQILREMLYNLCENAIKYNRPGGDVCVAILDRGKEVELSVRDSGIGIPYAHQNRIFERFYRVDKSHSKAIGGTGLGLSIVKHGAQYHQARLTLESEVGKGSCFRLLFKKEAL